jgi:hypothetical protein
MKKCGSKKMKGYMGGGMVKKMADGGGVSPRKKEAMTSQSKCRVRGFK